ncbi:MAG: hypothetical protein V4655_11875 [Bdellovibrionota bacterium]
MNNQRPQRSNFDLICGMILGGLVVGVMLPVTSKYLAEQDAKALRSLRARAPLVHEMKKTGANKEKKSIASADATPAKIAEKIDAKVIEAENVSETKAPELKAVEAKVEAPKLDIAKADTAKVKKIKKTKKMASKAKSKTSHIEDSYSESLEEMSETSAPKVAANESNLVTVPNAQYSKDQLSSCSKKCLIKSTDAFGKTIHAVINGPEFADALKEHQGTINMVGEKRLVKNQEMFFVQSITFNLPSRTTAKASTQSSTAPMKPSDKAWEDLSEM